MKKPLFLLFTGLLLSCLIPVHTVAAQELPTQKETLENIIKVNDYFMIFSKVVINLYDIL